MRAAELRNIAGEVAATVPADLAHVDHAYIDEVAGDELQRWREWYHAAAEEVVAAAEGDGRACRDAISPPPDIDVPRPACESLLLMAAIRCERRSFPVTELARHLAEMCLEGHPLRPSVAATPELVALARMALPMEARRSRRDLAVGEQVLSEYEDVLAGKAPMPKVGAAVTLP